MFVLIILFAALVILHAPQPPAWRSELETYIAYKSDQFNETITIVAMGRARRPYHLSEHLGYERFGHGPHYRVDHLYQGGSGGIRPLPFPPQKVWCVLVQRAHPLTGHSSQMIFVALHQDLYNASWVVHEGERLPFTREFRQRISQLGCDGVLRS
jgi:hypothetical protein